MEQKISKEELDERVMILRKFKLLLEQQRKKFQEYLRVLEKQETKITEEDTDALVAHSELETQIVQGIGALQKVIVPMQELYNKSGAAFYNPSEAYPVSQIQADLSRLQSQVLAQNEKNRLLLKDRLGQLKKQISDFRNPYRSLNSIYAQKSFPSGTRIQVEV
ncbi:flagellar biosynthesis protein FlgN [Treponema sp.]|uniref:flagellar biosynthesis protein FlgN n=1 Tax=Treponema sp. TaxID=166 RepID=UPI003F0929F8